MLARRILAAALFVSPFLPATGAMAQKGQPEGGQPVVGISTVTTYSAQARITNVDVNARIVTLAFTDGAVATRKVSPAVANFGATRVGDMVSLDFEDRITFVLSGPNTRVPRDRSVRTTATTVSGGTAAGATAGQTVANWWVTAVNPSAGTISVVNPAGGQVWTYTVTTAEGRAQLPRVKPGDSLTAINSDQAVVSITPAAR